MDDAIAISERRNRKSEENKSPRQTRRCHCKRNAATQSYQQLEQKNPPTSMRYAMNICASLIMAFAPKTKSFNAKFETNFDSTLEKINVIPQDIGRVILNLINNAFYAVAEKRKS